MAARRGVSKDVIRMRYNRLRKKIYDATAVNPDNGEGSNDKPDNRKDEDVNEAWMEGIEYADANQNDQAMKTLKNKRSGIRLSTATALAAWVFRHLPLPCPRIQALGPVSHRAPTVLCIFEHDRTWWLLIDKYAVLADLFNSLVLRNI